jgi:hypothetical protein
MKAIILGVVSVAAILVGASAPASALSTGVTGGTSFGGNASISSTGKLKMGAHVGPDGIYAYFDGGTVICTKANVGMSGGYTIGNTTPVKVEPTTLPSATPDKDCNANEVVANPPANTTVTINGVCGDPAELAKITQAHANVIINSTGPCATDTPAGPVKPAVVIVTQNAPTPAKAASVVSVSETPAELPQTGANGMVLAAAAASLAVLAYAGTMAIRTFRARA